jgi:cell division septation protein DedD
MPRSQLFAGLNTEESTEGEERIAQMTEEAQEVVEGMIDEGVESVIPEAPEVLEAPAKVEVKTDSAPLDLNTPESVEVPVKVEPVEEKADSVQVATPPASGDYYIQVGSVRSAEGAEGEWKKIQAKYPVLSGYSHRVESADLGDKGMFYRIQAGPVSQEAAASTCNSIKKIDPNGCLVKKK